MWSMIPLAKVDWKAIVGTVAPTIATALGGPLAGLATKTIIDALGLPTDALEEQVEAAVRNATPEQLLALKTADYKFQTDMKMLEVDLVRIAASDRDSARKRETTTGDSWTPRILAGVVVATWGFIQWHILNHSIVDDMRELAMRVLGTLDAALLVVLYYYFGGSVGGGSNHTTVVGERRSR